MTMMISIRIEVHVFLVGLGPGRWMGYVWDHSRKVILKNRCFLSTFSSYSIIRVPGHIAKPTSGTKDSEVVR